MLFNSVPFLIFLPLTFWAYHLLRRPAQNVLLLGASYLFYAWWDWRFLSLLLFSTVVDFCCGRAIARGPRRRRYLGLSLATNLGLLGVCKYFNFFTGSLAELLRGLGYEGSLWTIDLVLPVGISFYTFQSMSYCIDIYRGELRPTRSLLSFACFVAFFPQLVAGPIERAARLLPQFERPRTFDVERAADGCRQMLWGFFKKMVVADNLAPFVDAAFASPAEVSGPTMLAAVYCFAFQIYCDFSGYSDIAIGTARLFGFDLRTNFRTPYFASDLADFWRRWHISLSTWFRDYVYIPLGGSRGSGRERARAVLATFLVSGFWHGASWTFGAWGLLHALGLLAQRGWRRLRGERAPGRLRRALAVVATFHFVLLAWILFRANQPEDCAVIFSTLLRLDGPASLPRAQALLGLVLLLGLEWRQRSARHGLAVESWSRWSRRSLYGLLTAAVLLLGNTGSHAFIYFQF